MESVEKAVKEAFNQYQPRLTESNAEYGEPNIGALVTSVISSIQPMTMEAVSAAISATTETILLSIRSDVNELQIEKKELSDLKAKVRRQMSDTERLE